MKQKSITITVANHKGGVGKTTTAVTIATGLAGRGYPVVLVDLDSQGNVADFLELERRSAVYELVIQDKEPVKVIQPVRNYPTLGIVTGNQDTLEIEDALNSKRRFEPTTAIANALKPFRSGGNGKPTIIILDTAPSLSALQVSALYASDWLIVPASPEFAGETGVAALTSSVNRLKSRNAAINLLGILPTLVDVRSKEHSQIIERWQERLPNLILPPVRRRIAIAEAPGEGLPIWLYKPEAAADYAAVLVSVAKRVGVSL